MTAEELCRVITLEQKRGSVQKNGNGEVKNEET